jgi:apolipoprotein N-acyltransferase
MLILLPLLAAVLRGGALPGWWLPPECALLVIPLRVWYWEKGGSKWGDYLGGLLHVLIYFNFLHNTYPFAQVAVGVILGVWWLVERALWSGLRRWLPTALAGALAIVAVEWLRFHGPMGGVPWGSLALGFADRPVALDWASVLGESGWVFLIALCGAALYSLFGPRRGAFAHSLECLPAALLAVLAWASVEAVAEVKGSVRTLSVQGNLSIEDKHGSHAKRGPNEVFARQAELAWLGMDAEPEAEIVLWSETMWPYPVTPAEGDPFSEGFMIRPWPNSEEMRTTDYLREVNAANVQHLLRGRDSGRVFITGAHFYLGVPEKDTWRPGEPRRPETWSPRTSEFLAFNERGELEDHFSKSELVPFGERLPFNGKFPGAEWLALEMLRATQLYPRFANTGRSGPLQVDRWVLGGAVCWENVYERPFRTQADRGAEAFLILSNENWYRISEEMDQMVAATRLRAAETGRPILRVANTGITALFDRRGELLGALPRGERGWFGADLSLIDGSFRTPYLRWGWRLQPLVTLLALLGAGFGWILARRRRVSGLPQEAADRLLDPSEGRR